MRNLAAKCRRFCVGILLSIAAWAAFSVASTAQIVSSVSEVSTRADSMSPETISGEAMTTAPSPESFSRCRTDFGSSVVEPHTALPDAPSVTVYRPLSTHCKFELFLHQVYAPSTFASAVFDATWNQILGQWPEYGGGMQGWGKRLGASYADMESRRFIQGFVLSSLLRQDPRYFRCGKKNVAARAFYAATRVVVTRSDRGNSEVNTSEILGALFSSSLQNAYYPDRYRTFEGTMARFVGAFGSDATTNLLHEFAPDLRRLFHTHAPHKVLEIEQKLPLPPDDKP